MRYKRKRLSKKRLQKLGIDFDSDHETEAPNKSLEEAIHSGEAALDPHTDAGLMVASNKRPAAGELSVSL